MLKSSEPICFKTKHAVRRMALLKREPYKRNRGHVCKEEALVSIPEGTAYQCDCGIFHVRIHATTLHLTPLQFDAAARLFKLAWGIVIGRRLSASVSGLKRLPIVALLLTGLLV